MKTGATILAGGLVVGAMSWWCLPFFTCQGAGPAGKAARGPARNLRSDAPIDCPAAASAARRGEMLDETLITIIHTWAGQDAPGATRRVRTFPAGSFRDRALDEIAGRLPPAPGDGTADGQ